MSTKPQRVTSHYYTVGPRPFSGYALSYYDAYVLQVMTAIRAWEAAVGLAQTTFWAYSFSQDPNTGIYVFRRVPITDYSLSTIETDSALVDHLIWSARITSDLRDQDLDAIEHAREVVIGNLPDPPTFEPHAPGELLGYGKAIGGNYIWDCMQAVNALLSDQGMDLDDWLRDFKELTTDAGQLVTQYWRLGYLVEANGVPRVTDVIDFATPGHRSYNLTTDQIEALRIWPRSTLLICDLAGHVGLIDGRLEDRDSLGAAYSSGDKVAEWVRLPEHDFAALVNWADVRAVTWRKNHVTYGIRGAWYICCADALHEVNYDSGWTRRHALADDAVDAIAMRTAARYAWDTASVLHEDGTITSWQEVDDGLYAAHNAVIRRQPAGITQVSPGVWEPVPMVAFDAYEPAGICCLEVDPSHTEIWYPAPAGYPEGAVEGQYHTSLVAVADWQHERLLLVAYNPGWRLLSGLDSGAAAWHDLWRLVGEVPLSFRPTGITTETPEGTGKDGAITRWRTLVGERDTCRIHAVDWYANYPQELRMVSNFSAGGSVKEQGQDGRQYVEALRAASFCYDDDNRATDSAAWPPFRVRFVVPNALRDYEIPTVELYSTSSGAALHALLTLDNDGYNWNHASTPAGGCRHLGHLVWTWPTNAQLNALAAGIELTYEDSDWVFTIDPNAAGGWASWDVWTIPGTEIITIDGDGIEFHLGDVIGSEWLCCGLDPNEGDPKWVIATYYIGYDDLGSWWEFTRMRLDNTGTGAWIPFGGGGPTWYARDGSSWITGGSSDTYYFDGALTAEQLWDEFWVDGDTPFVTAHPYSSGSYNLRALGTGDLYAGYHTGFDSPVAVAWQLLPDGIDYKLVPRWFLNDVWHTSFGLALNAMVR